MRRRPCGERFAFRVRPRARTGPVLGPAGRGTMDRRRAIERTGAAASLESSAPGPVGFGAGTRERARQPDVRVSRIDDFGKRSARGRGGLRLDDVEERAREEPPRGAEARGERGRRSGAAREDEDRRARGRSEKRLGLCRERLGGDLLLAVPARVHRDRGREEDDARRRTRSLETVVELGSPVARGRDRPSGACGSLEESGERLAGRGPASSGRRRTRNARARSPAPSGTAGGADARRSATNGRKTNAVRPGRMSAPVAVCATARRTSDPVRTAATGESTPRRSRRRRRARSAAAENREREGERFDGLDPEGEVRGKVAEGARELGAARPRHRRRGLAERNARPRRGEEGGGGAREHERLPCRRDARRTREGRAPRRGTPRGSA